MRRIHLLYILLIAMSLSCERPVTQEPSDTKVEDPLSSWNPGSSKEAIIDFVQSTVNPESALFVPEKERVAVFDNDGCLWSEQPMYFQLIYAIDYIKKEAPNHPEWNDSETIQHVLQNDIEAALAGGEHAILELVMNSHAGMSAEEFANSVKTWLNTSRHPKTGQPYNQMIYKPMLELLEYLRANGYKTFIVSGGGIDFMRVWAEEAYDIPPYQVIGSSVKAKYEVVNGIPQITKLPELDFIDDKAGKPVGIHQHIGMRPTFAAGNSDGDYEMLQYTLTSDRPHFGMIIHHTDSVREYAYDRESSIGRLDKALDDATEYGWIIVDMKEDWNTIYPFN